MMMRCALVTPAGTVMVPVSAAMHILGVFTHLQVLQICGRDNWLFGINMVLFSRAARYGWN